MNIPDEAIEAAARVMAASNLCPDDAQSAEDSRWGAFQQDARAALEAAAPLLMAKSVTGSTSDGYHSFDELYDYRMLYNAHAAHGWLAAGLPVVKSWQHSDGELCFGGGWFIVTATLPTGQVSNHYAAEHWGLFDVPPVSRPPEWDGHTPADAADRLREYAANPYRP